MNRPQLAMRWQVIDRAAVPGGGELRLKKRGDEFRISLGATSLMNSRGTGSEEALGTLACQRIRRRRNPHVLIGGLGMGFTLRAALAFLGPEARITVAELVPGVIDWAHGPLAKLYDISLKDPRLDLREGDVAALIRTARSAYDAILLDVDNGPEGLTREANDALYNDKGLLAARAALRPRGVLAVWSSWPSRDFTKRLQACGFEYDQLSVRAGEAGSVIWLATRVA